AVWEDVGRSSSPCPPVPAHRWLAGRPQFQLHFTPAYASWINQVERWVRRTGTALPRTRCLLLPRRTEDGARELDQDLEHQRPPFKWTKPADQIIDRSAAAAHVSPGRVISGRGRPPSQPPPRGLGLGELRAGQAGLRSARWWHGGRGEH